MSLNLVNIKQIEKIRNPLANKIIIQPKYFDKNVCKFRKKPSDTEELRETTAVIKIIKETELKNLDLLILFILKALKWNTIKFNNLVINP